MIAPRPPDGQLGISADDAVRTGARMCRPVPIGKMLNAIRDSLTVVDDDAEASE